MHAMRAPDRLRRRLGQPDKADLPGLYEIRHRTDRLFDRHGTIDPMLIVQVNDVGVEPLERRIARCAHVLGTAVLALPLSVGTAHVAEFGGEHKTVSLPLDR